MRAECVVFGRCHIRLIAFCHAAQIDYIILRKIPQFSSMETCAVGFDESGLNWELTLEKLYRTLMIFRPIRLNFFQVCRPYPCNRSL